MIKNILFIVILFLQFNVYAHAEKALIIAYSISWITVTFILLLTIFFMKVIRCKKFIFLLYVILTALSIPFSLSVISTFNISCFFLNELYCLFFWLFIVPYLLCLLVGRWCKKKEYKETPQSRRQMDDESQGH